MKELLVLLTVASAALTGGHTIETIDTGEIEIVRSENDIDEYIYDTCMYIMSNDKYDFENVGVREVLDFYQEIAYTNDLTINEKSWLLDTMANEYMHECIAKEGHLCWHRENDSISINLLY